MGISNLQVLRDEYHYYQRTGSLMSDTEQNYDDEDVLTALQRVTQDGPGFEVEEDLPPGDFDSFSEPDVENDHDGDNEGSSGQEDTK